MQTTNTPLQHLHQQSLSPSTELILYEFSKPTAILLLLSPSSPQMSLQATGRERTSFKIQCQMQQQLGMESAMDTRLQSSNSSAIVKGVMGNSATD